MDVTVGVVAHPNRRAAALDIAHTVDAESIIFDSDQRGERWCHQETLLSLIEIGGDWLVWVEDDAVPCRDFRTLLSTALESAGDSIVSLYLGTGLAAGQEAARHTKWVSHLIGRADSDGSSWIEARELWHGVGVAVPAERARSLLSSLRRSILPTDHATSVWARSQKVRVRYCWPSLVDHADDQSLSAAEHPPRRAFRTHPM